MSMIRLGCCLLFVSFATAGCSTLHIGKNPTGVSTADRSEYCGTPSQASEVHYFADENAFENWVEYRNILGFDADLARDGVLIVEMGQRPTGGYKLILNREKTNIEDNTLNIVMDWHAPRLDAAVGQAMITQCVAVDLPKGQYDHVKVLDQIGNVRGNIDLPKNANG